MRCKCRVRVGAVVSMYCHVSPFSLAASASLAKILEWLIIERHGI